MRTKLKPALATVARSSGVALGLPHAVSPVGTSRLLPRFQPRRNFAKSSGDVRVKSPKLGAGVARSGSEGLPILLAAGGVRQEPARSARQALKKKAAVDAPSAVRFIGVQYYEPSVVHNQVNCDRHITRQRGDATVRHGSRGRPVDVMQDAQSISCLNPAKSGKLSAQRARASRWLRSARVIAMDDSA